jgi:NADPH2 dehydrogenase
MSCHQSAFPEVASFKTADELNNRLAGLGLDMRAERRLLVGADSPLHTPVRFGPVTLANRWCIQPIRGCDASADGRPTERTRQRWRRWGQSGAKLIWGCEAVAVRGDGRSDPNQLLMSERAIGALKSLRETLVDEHNKAFGRNGLLIGLQLSHAGRFARPKGRPEPRPVYRHPILDRIQATPDAPVVDDNWIEELIQAFVTAAHMAFDAGFDIVDIAHCHGEFAHELLSAHSRPGAFGGSLSNRTLFLRRVVAGIRRQVPKLLIGVRLSAFDVVPHLAGPNGVGQPAEYASLLPYRWGFGLRSDDPQQIDLTEPLQFVRTCREIGVVALNVTAGSPYYSPHVQRPAWTPAEGDYAAPEDPLAGAARLLSVATALKARFPDLSVVASGLSCLQNYLPHVAQWAVARHKIDFIGLGRMAISYWRLPADLWLGRPVDSARICRTRQHCVTAARRGQPPACPGGDGQAQTG